MTSAARDIVQEGRALWRDSERNLTLRGVEWEQRCAP